MEAQENRNMIVKHFKSYSDNPANINLQQMWKTLQNFGLNVEPRCQQPKRTIEVE